MSEHPDTWKTFPNIMKKIIEGKITPPNLEPMDNDRAVYYIATYGFPIERGQFRNPDGHTSWATYFLGVQRLMGRQDGSGMVLYYASGRSENGKWIEAQGKAAIFAICKHTPVEDPGANHSRGWHPAHCSTCGIDLSVDSGD